MMTKTGRNDPCPCGNGKKYKKCHGQTPSVTAVPNVQGVAEEDRALYESVLGEIRLRTDVGLAELSKPLVSPPALESSALQLRKSLELIVLGSLVTNRAEVEPIASAFDRKDADEARKLVKRVNPEYWPTPKIQGAPSGNPPMFKLQEQTKPFLREQDWGRAFGFSSDLLHADNPFDPKAFGIRSPPARLMQVRSDLRKWFDLLVALLNHHQVTLVDRDYLLLCSMRVEPGNGVQVVVFKKVEHPDQEPTP